MDVRIMSSKGGCFFFQKGKWNSDFKILFHFQTQNFKDWYILPECHYYIISTVCIYKGQNICL